jgi:hypothetical protein
MAGILAAPHHRKNRGLNSRPTNLRDAYTLPEAMAAIEELQSPVARM